jgi:hypothetical protein
MGGELGPTSHIYVDIHLLEQLCRLHLIGAQQQCVRSSCEGMCRWSSDLTS